MKALLAIDYYVWKIFILRIKPAWFKSRLLSALSLLYVAFFPLPRKFLLHYFRGAGSRVNTDTMDLILKNQGVLASLQKAIDEYAGSQDHTGNKDHKGSNDHTGNKDHKGSNDHTGSKNPSLFIGQHLLSHPNHRYSIGSLHLHYQIEEKLVHISMHARYRFSGENDRITRYLHQWLDAFRQKGAAANFDIQGRTWTLPAHAFMSMEVAPRYRKYVGYNILYI